MSASAQAEQATQQTGGRLSSHDFVPPFCTQLCIPKGLTMKNSTSRRNDARTGSSYSSHEAAGNELAPWNFLSELGRQQLALATESASALYRSNESLRKIQQEAAHEASVRHAEAAHKLFSPCEPAELLSLQSELLRTDMQCVSQYWQQLATATMQAQREMMSNMSHLLDSEASGSGIKSALEAFQAAIPAMAMPGNFMPWQQQGTNAQSTQSPGP
jgi:hypothetical protein